MATGAFPGADGTQNPWWVLYGKRGGQLGAARADLVGVRLDSELWSWPLLTTPDGRFMTNVPGQEVVFPGGQRWGNVTLPTFTVNLVAGIPGAAPELLEYVNVAPGLTMLQASSAAAAIAIAVTPASVVPRPGGIAILQAVAEWQAALGLLGNIDQGTWCSFTSGAVQDVTDPRFVRNGGGAAAGHWYDVNGSVDLGLIIGGASRPTHGIAGAFHALTSFVGADIADLANNPLGALLAGLVIVSGGGFIEELEGAAQVITAGAAAGDATGLTHGALSGLGSGASWVATHPAEAGDIAGGAELIIAGGKTGNKSLAADGAALLGRGIASIGANGVDGSAATGFQVGNLLGEKNALEARGGNYWWNFLKRNRGKT